MTSKPGSFAAAFCQVPFSENPKSPVCISCQLVVWVLLITEFGARPFFTQLVQRSRAATPPVESSCVSLAPEPQNQGRNWKLPSSVPIPEKVMPFLPAALTLPSAAVSDGQSLTVAMSTPAAVRTTLL